MWIIERGKISQVYLQISWGRCLAEKVLNAIFSLQNDSSRESKSCWNYQKIMAENLDGLALRTGLLAVDSEAGVIFSIVYASHCSGGFMRVLRRSEILILLS
jgi:hypothetical protein